jgi:hypothetical protein
MPFAQPKAWKTLERHPLSSEYDDIPSIMFKAMIDGVRQFGIVGREIILHEGKVLDGWQLLRACIEADVKPEFAPLPKGVSAEEYVQLKNDVRRHETMPKAMARIEARRERITKAREEGKSIRTIAEEEGVSPKTIRNDLASGGEGYPPEPAKTLEKVQGRDGKSYPSTQPALRCDRCTRIGSNIPNCPKCLELRGKKKPLPQPPNFDDPEDDEKPKAKNGKPRYDEKRFEKAYGVLIREVDKRAELMGKGKHHKRCIELLGMFLEAYKVWKVEG